MNATANPPLRRPEILREPVASSTFGIVEKPLSRWERISNITMLRKLALLVVLALVWEAYARALANPRGPTGVAGFELAEPRPQARGVELGDGERTDAALRATRPAREAVAGEPASELAWYPAAPPLLDQTLVAVPDGPSPKLHLVNPGDADATVDLGAGRTVTVAAGGAASVAVRAGDGLLLDGAKGLHASVVFSGERRLAAFAVQPPGPLEAPIVVYPR